MQNSRYIPQTSTMVPAKALGQAVTTNDTALNTTAVANSIVGDKELHIRLLVAGSSDVADVTFIFGAWNTDTAIKSGVTFSADGFASFAAFKSYFEKISTSVLGLRMETDNTANFQSTLTFTEKDPSGEDWTVKQRLSKYRVPVGNGYSETIEIGSDDLKFVLWQGLEATISNIKGESQIDIYLYVNGWNKAQFQSPLQKALI